MARSCERLFHDAQIPRVRVAAAHGSGAGLRPRRTAARTRDRRPVCVPETERASHYVHARLTEQVDFVLHFDETRGLEPLERNAVWEAGEVAETSPQACEGR